jgi:ankyrin repeat protein
MINNYKKKYLKYKMKYLELKNNQNILQGGQHIFDNGIIKHKIDKALNEFRWQIDTILIDCIRDIKTQEKTNKIIEYIFENDYIRLENLSVQVNWALTYAVKLGLPYVTNKLLELGADPNFIDQYGMSLIEYAIDEKYGKTLSYLLNKTSIQNDDLIQNKYNKFVEEKIYNDQEDEIDQSIFANEVNMKIYNGIKKKILDKKIINLDFDSIDINIE